MTKGSPALILFGVGGAMLLAGCVTRPPGTDLFGRPIATPAPTTVTPTPTSGPSPSPPPSRTVAGGSPDDLLAGITLRPLPSGTTGTALAVTANARSVAAGRYVVRPGDTLRGIGNRTGAGSEALALANRLAPPYLIHAGQTLIVPAGRYHEVLEGQTGIAIARAYGVRWADIVGVNALAEPAVLRVGQRLRLPDGASRTTGDSLEARASAFHLDIDDIVTGSQPAERVATTPPASATIANATSSPTGPQRFAWPLTGRLLQRFGPAGGGRVNSGIKIAAPLGTPVRAAAGGVVSYAGNEVPLLGGLVLIDHGGGWVSAYGHLDRVAVRPGEHIAADAIIATSGESGQAREPELHFELRHNRQPVDPLRELPSR